MNDQHKPIAPELTASPAPHAPTSAEPRETCMGCGKTHGSIGQHIRCLNREIGELAGVMRWAAQHGESTLQKYVSAGVTASAVSLETIVKALKSKLRVPR